MTTTAAVPDTCACIPSPVAAVKSGRPCLLHYSLLPPHSQRAQRDRLGIRSTSP